MQLYGIVNASPDSTVTDSIVSTPAEALERARGLLADGADAIDLGGQGSTERAEVVDWHVEWERVEHLVPALASLGVDVSIDSWRPEVVARALQAGATVINAADGMQSDAMWQVAADFDVPIVIPYLAGPDPKHLGSLRTDPISAMVDFFEARLAEADRYGRRDRCIIDPGTGFAPVNWARTDPFGYQKLVFSRMHELRRFGLPIYIALPYASDDDELLEIVLQQRPDIGRCHYPAHVRRVEQRLGTADVQA